MDWPQLTIRKDAYKIEIVMTNNNLIRVCLVGMIAMIADINKKAEDARIASDDMNRNFRPKGMSLFQIEFGFIEYNSMCANPAKTHILRNE